MCLFYYLQSATLLRNLLRASLTLPSLVLHTLACIKWQAGLRTRACLAWRRRRQASAHTHTHTRTHSCSLSHGRNSIRRPRVWPNPWYLYLPGFLERGFSLSLTLSPSLSLRSRPRGFAEFRRFAASTLRLITLSCVVVAVVFVLVATASGEVSFEKGKPLSLVLSL